MVLSMTGYGAGQTALEGVLVKVELRAVNHRFFDPSIRISRDFAGLEGRVKELLAERIRRGRVTVSVDVESDGAGDELVLDEPLAASYQRILRILEEKFGLAAPSESVAFLQLPDVVRREAREIDGSRVESALEGAVAAALQQLDEMRRNEGEALGSDLERRVHRIDELLEGIERGSSGLVEAARSRLEEKVAQLVPQGTSPDAERLATEVAILADKADITEELVRFRAHDEAFLGFLKKEEPVGKRLDFLLQEMNREANTIGSKSASAEIAHLVVEVKEEIERLREQVQNIE